MKRVRATALLLSSLLLVGCSGGADGDDQAHQSNASAMASDASEDATPLLDDCALTKRKVRFLVRDWERVVGSVGRGDHHEYTRAFVKEMRPTVTAADGCPGADQLDAFVASVKAIDASAKKPRIRYGLYRKAARQGNEWLGELNWGTEAFAEG